MRRGAKDRSRVARAWVLAAGLAALGACTMPAERADRIARDAGVDRALVEGTGYTHVVYSRGAPFDGELVRVYLEGDGTPYLSRRQAASDPTPRRPLMLGLMTADPSAAAVYVARPCYFGHATLPPCTPYDWTLGRFSPRMLDSMAAAVTRATAGAAALELYGHSGGATFAVLLARRLPNVVRVVTLAGNLDPRAWTALHGYTPLQELVDPLAGGALPPGVRQLHVAGARDRNVPAELVSRAARALGATDVRILPEADHSCCWREHWPALRDGIVTAPDGV